jgi:hypothetical protein
MGQVQRRQSERPILIRDPDSGLYEPALQEGSNRLHLDLLFSWQPTPGPVFFAGYGGTLDDVGPVRRNTPRAGPSGRAGVRSGGTEGWGLAARDNAG